MISITVVLYLVAAILFALAFFRVGTGKFDLVAGGLFCWVLTFLIGKIAV